MNEIEIYAAVAGNIKQVILQEALYDMSIDQFELCGQ